MEDSEMTQYLTETTSPDHGKIMRNPSAPEPPEGRKVMLVDMAEAGIPGTESVTSHAGLADMHPANI